MDGFSDVRELQRRVKTALLTPVTEADRGRHRGGIHVVIWWPWAPSPRRVTDAHDAMSNQQGPALTRCPARPHGAGREIGYSRIEGTT